MALGGWRSVIGLASKAWSPPGLLDDPIVQVCRHQDAGRLPPPVCTCLRVSRPPGGHVHVQRMNAPPPSGRSAAPAPRLPPRACGNLEAELPLGEPRGTQSLVVGDQQRWVARHQTLNLMLRLPPIGLLAKWDTNSVALLMSTVVGLYKSETHPYSLRPLFGCVDVRYFLFSY